MASVAIILLVLLFAWYVGSFLRRHGHGIVARRGISTGADLGALAAAPKVRVRAVTQEGPGRVRLLLAPEPAADGAPHPAGASDLDLVVLVDEGDFGFELLRDWERSGSVLAIVRTPGGRIARLRSVDDLQPLTLRLDEG